MPIVKLPKPILNALVFLNVLKFDDLLHLSYAQARGKDKLNILDIERGRRLVYRDKLR